MVELIVLCLAIKTMKINVDFLVTKMSLCKQAQIMISM